MRWPHYLLLLTLVAALAALALETRRLAALAGDFERRVIVSEQQLEAA